MNYQETFNDLRSKDASKDDILRHFIAGGATVIEAVSEYKKLAREAGLIKSVDERMEWLDEHLNEEVFSDTSTRKSFAKGYAKQMDISVHTANADMKKWADENDIIIPGTSRHRLENLVNFVKGLLGQDMGRQEILEALQDEMNYTESSAVGAYSRALKELGITPAGAGPQVPMEQLVYLIRSHEHLSQKELVAKIQETYGYKQSTARTFLTYVKFAKEWMRQAQLGNEAAKAA